MAGGARGPPGGDRDCLAAAKATHAVTAWADVDSGVEIRVVRGS